MSMPRTRSIESWSISQHRLLRETEGVVTVAVELLGGQSAEVTDGEAPPREQAVQELHTRSPRSVTRTDRPGPHAA